jgi:2,4-dienoyl-CoA reductase-like NADH-dependent reductase (Old Yellow Enzyme family)
MQNGSNRNISDVSVRSAITVVGHKEALMNRKHYLLFSDGEIGGMRVRNRLVRSATFDRGVYRDGKVTDETFALYSNLAAGGVGVIITGIVPVMSSNPTERRTEGNREGYEYSKVPGYERIAEVVHEASSDCRIFVQLMGVTSAGPSEMKSLRSGKHIDMLSAQGIEVAVDCFVAAIVDMKEMGFDGVQLHAAFLHNCLSYFLSPYFNHRTDDYGGSPANRARIVKKIVSKARESVADFPMIIKVNGTDNIKGGMELSQFPEMAREIEKTGVDAIEISGMPSAPRREKVDKPSYFLEYAQSVEVECPVMLVGGNRDVDDLEEIVTRHPVDYISLCRPLICEPDLPNRWLAGKGSSKSECISCSSCSYALHQMGRDHVVCLYKHDKENHRRAQEYFAASGR